MKTILIIDDDELFRFILGEWMRTEGFHPIEAGNGHEAVQLAHAHQPALIFCDIEMPHKDGIAVLTELRNHPRTATIPFFFLTGETSWHTASLQQLGADGVITKDGTTDAIRQVLNQLDDVTD